MNARRRLRAALGFAVVPRDEPELKLLHRWLDCWRGIGDVVRGMARQEYDLDRAAPLRRPGLARDVLPQQLRALADVTRGECVGP